MNGAVGCKKSKATQSACQCYKLTKKQDSSVTPQGLRSCVSISWVEPSLGFVSLRSMRAKGKAPYYRGGKRLHSARAYLASAPVRETSGKYQFVEQTNLQRRTDAAPPPSPPRLRCSFPCIFMLSTDGNFRSWKVANEGVQRDMWDRPAEHSNGASTCERFLFAK